MRGVEGSAGRRGLLSQPRQGRPLYQKRKRFAEVRPCAQRPLLNSRSPLDRVQTQAAI